MPVASEVDVSVPSKPTKDFMAIQETIQSTVGRAIMKWGKVTDLNPQTL